MKKQELIKACENAQKGISFTEKFLHTARVIITEVKKFLVEIDFSTNTVSK